MKKSTINTELSDIFDSSITVVDDDSKSTHHTMISDNLTTTIACNYEPCSAQLIEFTSAFNTLLKGSRGLNCITINAFILENEILFHRIETMFLCEKWSSNNSINKFNIATHDTSSAKCSNDERFYILKCYDYFYYIYDTGSNKCLLVVKDEKKALTMINILLLTPYLAFGDVYAIHGGLVSNGNDNILLSNSSLGGKTTIALLFLENGWQILTEETTYISKHGGIFNYNIRNYFNIRVGTYLEFKDLFIKAGITNDVFLNMSQMKRSELFEFGKKEQMSIYFDVISKDAIQLINDHITHALIVSLDKNTAGIAVNRTPSEGIVDRFLEIYYSPTVMLFKDLLNITNVIKEENKNELMRIFKNLKSYKVVSDLNYRKHFDLLLEQIDVLV